MAQLDLTLERGSDVPLGTQLAWKLRAAIAAGSLGPGDRLPGVRDLATAAGVNVNTARAVYARLAEQGVIVSEHGRGTFVADSGRGAGIAALVERVASEARRRDVDPRELAALLYARFDERAPAPLADEEDADARRALRAEIEALEQELTALEPPAPDVAAERTAGYPLGARLLTLHELEATRNALAQRVAEARRERRRARAAARAKATQPVVTEGRSAWPELLAVRPAT